MTSRRDEDRPPERTNPKSCTTTSGRGRPRRDSRFHQPTAATASAIVGERSWEYASVASWRLSSPSLPSSATLQGYTTRGTLEGFHTSPAMASARQSRASPDAIRRRHAIPCYAPGTRSEETMRPGFRPRPLLLLAAATASFTALTCDDSRPIAPLADKVAEAFCAHQFQCCSPFELSTLTQDRYTTEGGCLPFATLAARDQLGAVQASLLQGRITVDAAALDACVKAYRESACTPSTGYVYTPIGPTPNVLLILAYCPDVFVGHVPNNAACDLPQECQRGSSCSNGRNPGYYGIAGAPGNVSLTPTPGVCLAYQKAGEPCNTSFDCDPNAHLACRDF